VARVQRYKTIQEASPPRARLQPRPKAQVEAHCLTINLAVTNVHAPMVALLTFLRTGQCDLSPIESCRQSALHAPQPPPEQHNH
jgi:hypothetical protein